MSEHPTHNTRYVVRCRTDRRDLNGAEGEYAVMAGDEREACDLAAESFRADCHVALAFYVPNRKGIVTEVVDRG